MGFRCKKRIERPIYIYRYITINKTKIATWFSTRITAVSRVEILFFSPFRTGTSFFQSALCSYVIVYSIHEKIISTLFKSIRTYTIHVCTMRIYVQISIPLERTPKWLFTFCVRLNSPIFITITL